jgi:hypothetical protein
MSEIKRRKPQPKCRCGHALPKHHITVAIWPSGFSYNACCYCYSDCTEFVQDNLKTLERLYQYNEEKKKETSKLSV